MRCCHCQHRIEQVGGVWVEIETGQASCYASCDDGHGHRPMKEAR